MNFNKLFLFLETLQQNNHREWMDLNRAWYQEVREDYITWLDKMNLTIASLDPNYFDTPGRKALNRINNNLMFHPHKPVYKDHFGAGLDQLSKQGDFYIHLGVSECFIGGGYWHPSSTLLKSIRNAIDYNGEELKAIVTKKSFKNMFGDLVFTEELKTSPKGFSKDHPHIDLLRKKTFAVMRSISKKEILSVHYESLVLDTYKEMLPFRRYLNEAISV